MTRRIVKLKHLQGDTVASIHPTGSGKSWVAWMPKPVSAEETVKAYPNDEGFKCPYGEVGDVLWVREKWKKNDRPMGYPYFYYANNEDFTNPDYEKWKPSIFMPKEACRIFLTIKSIKVERLQDISEGDCCKEGCGNPILRDYKKPKFAALWDSINGNWNENPFVWVIEFEKK